MEGMKPPLYRWWAALFQWLRAFCIREVPRFVILLVYRGYLPISIPLLFCLALPTMIQFCEWLHSSWGSLWPSSVSSGIHLGVHYPPVSTAIDIIPSTLHMCSFWGLQSHHITWDLHPSLVDAPVDVHGRSCNFPLFHPREALLVGHQVTALPLFSCGILSFSPLTEVVLCGVGLVYLSHAWWLPIHKVTPTSDIMRSPIQWRNLRAGSSLHKRGCLSLSDAPPPMSPHPTYPWSSSFP